jgi:hypothetical protein
METVDRQDLYKYIIYVNANDLQQIYLGVIKCIKN